jgi:hypothetical protein
MKSLLILLAVLTFAVTGMAQGDAAATASDDERGFVLDQSTPEEAISALGQPSNNRLDKLNVQTIEKWIAPKRKEKIFRVLTFKEAQGYAKIEMTYLEGKLVMIHYVLKTRLPVEILPRAYGIAFRPLTNELEDSVRPENYYQLRDNVQVANYPSYYYMLGVARQSFISARIFNSGAEPNVAAGGQITRRARNVPDQRIGFNQPPGKITEIQIISRQLQSSTTEK